MNKDSSPKGLKQWSLINHQNNLYKIICITLTGAIFTLSILCYQMSQNVPIVAIKNESKTKYLTQTKRKRINPNDDSIKGFLREWIHLRFNWKEFNKDKILKNLSPLSTDGFIKKLNLNLKKVKTKDGQKIEDVSQYVAKININIGDEKIISSFDRIIRIKGMPVVTPTEILFDLVKGEKTKFNPVGLYVNGITSHEKK